MGLLLLANCLCILLSVSAAASASPCRELLGEAPQFLRVQPRLRPRRRPLGWDTAAATTAAKTTWGLADISNRTAVKNFFNKGYNASEGIAPGWTGSISSCSAGTLSAAYLNATLRRINWFRSMAGVPANVTLNPAWSKQAQEASLMFSAMSDIDHEPPSTWTCYTSSAAEAADNSNLSLGNKGPAAVDSQMRDRGAKNARVGHRRWLLYPWTRRMGIGAVDHYDVSAGVDGTAVIWIIDEDSWFDADGWELPRPATRSGFVAWPPPGYVPYQVVWARWSFSYPEADFAGATVTMRLGSESISTVVEEVGWYLGENSIVWLANTTDPEQSEPWPRPSEDQAIGVTVSNFLDGAGEVRSVSYVVHVMDPAT